MMPDILNPIRTIEASLGTSTNTESVRSRLSAKCPSKRESLWILEATRSIHPARCAKRRLTASRYLEHLQQSAPDLHAEMMGLDWSLGVVDLRRLLAFQRRLSFNSTLPS